MKTSTPPVQPTPSTIKANLETIQKSLEKFDPSAPNDQLKLTDREEDAIKKIAATIRQLKEPVKKEGAALLPEDMEILQKTLSNDKLKFSAEERRAIANIVANFELPKESEKGGAAPSKEDAAFLGKALSQEDAGQLLRAGAYAIHMRLDTESAGTILQAVYDATQKDGGLKTAFKADGSYFRLANDLSYALANKKKPTEEELQKVRGLVGEVLAESGNVEQQSFATRLKGHIKFAEAKKETDFTKKIAIAKEGFGFFSDGMKMLDSSKHVPELAKAEMRIATEYLHLLNAVPTLKPEDAAKTRSTDEIAQAAGLAKLRSEFLEEASTHVKVAEKLLNSVPGMHFLEYKGRVHSTLAGVYSANPNILGRRSITENHLKSAKRFFGMAGNKEAEQFCGNLLKGSEKDAEFTSMGL